ncbi:hypothetical protein M513_08865 [Trichuris suis]|uniref:RNase H type-1 domain-containing protein n=1 Tax=Trichuris suis TaxID=68888 RepID=A0A085LZ41_9BILA|nr:hypothetical protein M513_08865 [Trichuris suis]
MIIKGRKYALTRLGFSLNVALTVMKAVVERKGASAYIHDIFVNEDVVEANRVITHLARYGLSCKAPEQVASGGCALGLKVWKDRGTMMWSRAIEISTLPNRLTRRIAFAYYGELVGHYPDEPIQDVREKTTRTCLDLMAKVPTAATQAADQTASPPTHLHGLVQTRRSPLSRPRVTVRTRAHVEALDAGDAPWRQGMRTIGTEQAPAHACYHRGVTDMARDPVRRRWDVSGNRAKIWVGASSLAVGVALGVDGAIMEDEAWFRPDEARHINMAELDAAIKGLNLAVLRNMIDLRLMKDSLTVHRWIDDGLSARTRLRTKAANEMLIRRRVEIIQAHPALRRLMGLEKLFVK